METPHKNPYTELTEWLNGFPESERDKLSAKALISLKSDYEPELELENPKVDGDERWEELLADPRSDILLDRLCKEAEEEYKNGTVKPLSVALKEYAYLLEDDNS